MMSGWQISRKRCGVVIAHRHAPGPVEPIAARGGGAVGEVALERSNRPRAIARVSAPADQRRHLQRRQALARAFDGDVALGDDGAGRNVARGHQALGEVLAVDQFALAERALRQFFAASGFDFANARSPAP